MTAADGCCFYLRHFLLLPAAMNSLRLSILQTHLEWENSVANRDRIEQLLEAVPIGTRVVVLPEMFSTGFSMNPAAFAETPEGETVQWMTRIAREKKIILTGSFMAKEEDKFYNRLLWVLPDGKMGQYDKRHLFAFAGEDQHYTAGNKRLIASVNGWRINLQICYDLRFPVWSRQQSTYGEDGEFKPEYDLLVYVANWPARRSEAWKTLLRARAIENQCYVVGVNRIGKDGNGIDHSGDSMIIGPLGDVLYSCGEREELYSTELDAKSLQDTRDRFPFLRDADGFMIFSDDFPE
jgi:predicted amidohydrolase